MTLSKKYQKIMDQVQLTDEMKQRILQNVKGSLEETEKDAARKADQEAAQKTEEDRKQNIQNLYTDKSISRKFFVYRKTMRYLSAAACIMLLIVGGLTVPKLVNRGTMLGPVESAPGTTVAGNPGSENQGEPLLGAALPGDGAQESEAGEQQAMIANGMIEVDSLQELSEALGFEVPEVEHIPFEVSSTSYVNGWNEFAQVTYQGATPMKDQEENLEVLFRKAKGGEDISGDYNLYPDEKEVTVNAAAVTLKGENGNYCLATWQQNGFTYSLSCEPGVGEDVFMEMLQSIK